MNSTIPLMPGEWHPHPPSPYFNYCPYCGHSLHPVYPITTSIGTTTGNATVLDTEKK